MNEIFEHDKEDAEWTVKDCQNRIKGRGGFSKKEIKSCKNKNLLKQR
jgi:hypothetical protein